MPEQQSADAIIDWGVASKPMLGEVVLGDDCFVQVDARQGLIVVIDALGHGKDAAQAAQLAVKTIEEHASQPVPVIFERCHEVLRRTRGVVMSAARIFGPDHTLSWLGIGNVEGLVVHTDDDRITTRSFVIRGGVVGYQLPRLQVSTVTIEPGDTLVIATDGLKLDFISHLEQIDHPKQAAESILSRCGRDSDDALVLVARYRGVQA